AVPVAEIGLGMALSLARGIHTAHADFVAGREAYGLESNTKAEILTGSNIGFVGFGDLGRALHHLLSSFRANVRVFDPWLPDDYLRRQGVIPVTFDEVLSTSRVLFVAASVTSDNTHLFDAPALARMQTGAMLILLSRAALADFDAMAAEAASGRLRFATDVFPEEPVAPDDPIRRVPGILFSAHRAGALTSALRAIGDHVLEDLSLIERGLPPVTCRRAERETVGRLRSKPIKAS
ncbi:MAG: NAD(P)-dependent oxidoreductase, partial [Pseudomonadota bacterium]